MATLLRDRVQSAPRTRNAGAHSRGVSPQTHLRDVAPFAAKRASHRLLPTMLSAVARDSTSVHGSRHGLLDRVAAPGDEARHRGVGACAVAAMDFEVVVPRLDDAEELASVHVQAWREAYGELLPERFYDDAARERRRVMWSGLLAGADAGERVRVARREGRIVGFVARGPAAEHQGHPPKRDEQLYAVYVLSSCHGHGVGQALLDEALSERHAQLWVAKVNARARRFYEKNGFAADGTEQVDPDLDGLVEVRMVR